ncbi:LOW QUALITY PROTEIN: synaptonemal complex protein 2 [Calypte anna]|uniref:LOW QUALITY PROTEIN: synaptonemal complex protein 2 n=1 Tax=Calypte anna TaxID=9244 RepID=UPI0011C38DCA|nr:LOW QUALITY PROTEIN: synaptonemal complex protein 2 [Calypte anna]
MKCLQVWLKISSTYCWLYVIANLKVVRKLNLMLDNTPRDARKKIFSTKEMLLVMSDMGQRILDAGDYDLQVAITEALCRMVSEKQRAELASQWFSMEFVSNAFKGIKDSEFETDCRKFLNQVNGMLGDKRRVFTYPCLSAALDKHELQIPLDENLEEFWIDFNVGSRSISFYVAADDADQQWETVIIPEEGVDLYSLEEKDSKTLLTINLKSPMIVGNQEGENFFLYFDSVLEIKDTTRKIYGLSKCKGFSKKQTASVAKTTVHVVFDESGSQVLVPESQLSPCLDNKLKGEEKLNKYKTQQLPATSKTPGKNNNQDKCKVDSSKVTTARKRKVSEASVLIPGTTRLPTRSPLVFVSTATPHKGRFKLPLEMMSSAEKSNNNDINEMRTKSFYEEPTGSGQRCTLENGFCETEQKIRNSNIRNESKLPEKLMCAEEVLNMIQELDIVAAEKQTLDEALDVVPDSQPAGRGNKPMLSDLLESSFDKTKTWKKRACSVPKKNITTGDKQKLNPPLAHTPHPARVSETSLPSDFTNEEPDVLFKKDTANPNQLKTKAKSKEMTDATTKSLISKISDRYKDKTDEKNKARDSFSFSRPHLNKSYVSKEEVQNRNLKTTSALNITAAPTGDDIYNFHISGFDEPTIKLGSRQSHVTELGAYTGPNKKRNTDDSKTITEIKGSKKTTNSKNKKHLFSDTDTEYRADDSKTDISWLQESNRKSKAQLIDYSRNKNVKKAISTDKITADKFSEPACYMDKPKGKNANKKKINKNKCEKENSKADQIIEQATRQKRPRRAVVAKNYKEPSSSESEWERKTSACTSKEKKSKPQVYSCTLFLKQLNEENKGDDQKKELQNTVSTEPKGIANYVHKAFLKSKNSAEEKEMEMLSSESLASPETMRCAERISESDVAQEHDYSETSPGLQDSTPEKREVLNFEKGISPNNFCSQKKNIPSICLNQSPEMTIKKLTFGNKSFSPVLTEASLLSLRTSKTVSGKHSKGSVFETRDNNEDSSFRHCFSDTLAVKGKVQDITKHDTKSEEEDDAGTSPVSASSGRNVESWSKAPYHPVHESGPTIQPFSKRRYHSDTESNSDEVETNKEERKKRDRIMKLQPRKLFKTDDVVTCGVSETVSTWSVNDVTGSDGELWEPGCSTVSICQKLQKEFTKKIESRSRIMDCFAKQSLRAVHEHLTKMSYQLHECRIKQLDKFHFILLEEIENFEKDSVSLKNMEKEFMIFWKKHTHTFSAYMRSEQQRIQILKTSYEKNIYHTADYEKHIFTSEMNLMKEDIKGLQEKLLKEMQEEELCNVRRGLQALFQSEDRILK